MITPASYCVSQLFSDNTLQFEQPKLQKVYDYEILEQLEKQRQKQQQLMQVQTVQRNGSYFGSIGSRVFDNTDYTNGVVVPVGRKVFKQVDREESKPKRLHKIQMADRCIEQLEDELFLNY
ncbi:unnamed protein product [Paramecium octaurelia]|uniref:Uncharacterized protein n=1 Tax=Paramecium octaurelia TaxID=43137 RepID=A0A8S1XF10_PAROT|nr:unnamed protein product [Paramecium octaurelia]